MPAVMRQNQQLVSKDYCEDTATIENTSPSSASPVLIDPPTTPRTTHATLHTPLHTTQGPPTSHPTTTSLTVNSEALLLSMHRMMQQIQANLVDSKACIAELEAWNREPREEVYMICNPQSPSIKMNMQQQTTSPMAHSSQYTSHISELRSPHFDPQISLVEQDFPPQGHLDDMPRGRAHAYAQPGTIIQPTPRHTTFEAPQPNPQRLGSAFRTASPRHHEPIVTL